MALWEARLCRRITGPQMTYWVLLSGAVVRLLTRHRLCPRNHMEMAGSMSGPQSVTPQPASSLLTSAF